MPYRTDTFRVAMAGPADMAGLTGLIEDGVASGEFRKVDPHQTVFTLLGMTVFYFASAPVMSRVTGHNMLSAQALKIRRRALLDFLEHGLMRRQARSR